MKRKLLITVAVFCWAASFGTGLSFARGGQSGGGHPGGAGGGGHPGGGGPPGGGGGGHINAGGNPSHFTQSNTQHFSSGLNNASVGHFQQSHPTNVQSFSHPGNFNQNPANIHSGISGSPQVGLHPGFNSGLSGSPHVNQFQNGPIHSQVGPGFHSGPGPGAPNHLGGVNHPGIAHQAFVGNTMNIGNRPINFAAAGYRPAYYQHAGYYHGYWNGNRGFGGYWNNPYGYGGYGWGGSGLGYYGYGYRPFFWGLGGWGLGSLIYGSGYYGYTNPYYYPVGGAYAFNYSQPIPVSYNSYSPQYLANVPSGVDPNAAPLNTTDDVMNAAVAAFQQNDYDTALNIVNQGINQKPDDAVLHEFRGLILFAKGDYQQAAATVHSVLAVGPGWDWTTLSGLYADIGIYTNQLRALEVAVRQNPNDGAARFLLAYHYMSEGYPDAATQQLQQVVALVPNDQVAANLLKMTSDPQSNASNSPSANGSSLQPSQPPVNLPSPGQSATATVDPQSIVGNWRASRDDGSSFALTLTGGKRFSWSFTPKQQPAQSFDGTYSLDGNVIALERNGGGSLVAAITNNDASRFDFKIVGAPSEDPGLNFVR